MSILKFPGGVAAAAVAAAVLLPTVSAAVESTPTITISEGKDFIVAGAKAYLAVPGVALRQCDAVHTGPKALMQVEYSDGATVVVGPDSRLMFGVPRAGDAAGSHYLLSGWAKFTVPTRDKAAPHRVATPHFDLQLDAGVAVVRIEADQAQAFVEQGSMLARSAVGAAGETKVNAGAMYVRAPGQPSGAVAGKLDPGFVKAMPGALRDSLPALLTRIKARDVTAQPIPDPDAGITEGWRRGEAVLAPCLVNVTVRRAQEALQRHGIDVGPIDGLHGPRTKAALMDFQRKRGLAHTGQLDDATLKALDLPARR